MVKQIQVVAYQGGWDVIFEGARYAESHHVTRDEAVAAGVELARRDGATLVTYDREGRECTRTHYERTHAGTMPV